MPSLNPEAVPEDIQVVLDRLVAVHADPLALAIAAWNASWDNTQGAKDVEGDVQ